MSNKTYRRNLYMTLEDFIELTDDEHELIELLGHAHSLEAIAANVVKLRKTEANLIRAKLKKIRGEQKTIQVSDHAIVRYLERVTGMDVEALRKEMIAQIPDNYQFSEAVEYIPVDNGQQYIIRDGLVITVSPAGERVNDKLKDRKNIPVG